MSVNLLVSQQSEVQSLHGVTAEVILSHSLVVLLHRSRCLADIFINLRQIHGEVVFRVPFSSLSYINFLGTQSNITDYSSFSVPCLMTSSPGMC